jgi:Tfp pilus assembly protein PilO
LNHPIDASLLKLDAIGGLCVAGIVAAVAMLGVAPLIAERHEREASEEQLAELRTETEHAVAVLRDTRTVLRARTAEAEQIPDHLRIRRDINERIARIVEETESFGLTVQSITPGEPENGERFRRTPIELSTRAPIDAIARYLHGLHESSPDLELTTLQIRDPDEAGVLNATIRAEWITLAD